MTATNTPFDFIVYGATLEGLLVAEYLKGNGLRVAILDPDQKLQLASFNLYKSFDSNTFEKENFYSILNSFQLPFEAQDSECQTFEKGHFEPFVGFGENAPKGSEFFSAFKDSKRVLLKTTPQELALRFSVLDIRWGLSLTEIQFENHSVKSITLNDNHIYTAENFIFCVNPNEYVDLLDPKVVSQKTLQKIGRADFMSSLLLTLNHKNPCEIKNTSYVLYGTTKEAVVSVGSFFEKESCWMTFIPSDSTNINEDGVQNLKEMKRQIKRAIPTLFNDVEFEKISLIQASHGYIDLKSDVFGRIDGLKNLCLSTQFIVEGNNSVMRSLQAAYKTKELLSGFIDKAIDEIASPQSSGLDA